MIVFPDPVQANDDGLLAIGGNLQVETLLSAYRRGIFPWYGEGDPILWWSPDPRMVLFPAEFHASRRLKRRMRQPGYRFSFNEVFAEVIDACAHISRKGETGTWILPEMIAAYTRLHTLGHAHSLEVWYDGNLAGGVYGVLQSDVFFAESMFSRRTDGSKMALCKLCEKACSEGWKLIDCQFHTPHLASLGAREIRRTQFLQLLEGRSL